jgi:hypothetical protein
MEVWEVVLYGVIVASFFMCVLAAATLWIERKSRRRRR